MNLKNWFSGLFSANGTLELDIAIESLASEVYLKELAVQTCVNLISNTISKGEFITYEKGKQVYKDNHYLFNVEPNQNKAASKFWRDVIHKLVYENECLVVQMDNKLYVADSFSPKEFAFKENVYSNVVVSNFAITRSFLESEVLHFELHNERIKDIIDGLYASYSKLIVSRMNSYKKNNSRRGKLKIPTAYPTTEKAQKDLQDLLSDRFKRFFNADGDAVIPIANDLDYEELTSNYGSKDGNSSRDIKALIDDVFTFVAIGFQIPPQLLLGNVADTDKAVNNFLTFCINPLAEIINDETNRKMYGKKNYLERTYMKLDTSRIRAVDIKDVANAFDVLIRIGAYCVDDCLLMLGMEPLNTKESRARWMTKNYSPITEAIKGEGGEKLGNA